MKKSILVLFLIIQASLSADTYHDEIDKFFDIYKDGKTIEAIDTLYSTNPYIDSKSDKILKLKGQLASGPSTVGELYDFAKLDEFKVTDFFVQVTYIVAFDRQPIRFEFQFFKNSNGWMIYSFSFDNKIDDEIKTIARKRAIKVNEG